MQLRLKVMKGPMAGKMISFRRETFLIGRSEECSLRCNNDMVSRKHCLITLTESGVLVRDLESRNGTYVNDNRITAEQELVVGDQLRVGPLQFELILMEDDSSVLQPKAPAPAPPKATGPLDSGTRISMWLSEADDVERSQRMTEPETRQYKFDDTGVVPTAKTGEHESTVTDSQEGTHRVTEARPTATGKGDTKEDKPKGPGKLPKKALDVSAENTRDAAAQMLRKLFNRG